MVLRRWHPRRTMLKIEIVITNDAGESSVIASTHCLHPARPGAGAITTTNTSGHLEARRAMTAGDQMAASRLCLNAAAHMFVMDPTDLAALAAISAFHAAQKTGATEQSVGGISSLPDGGAIIEPPPSPHAKA